MLIALLEDDPAQAQLVGSWIREGGHGLDWFDTGHALLEAVGNAAYDLIILDWGLPDLPGDEVLTRIRQAHGWHVPVLFVTSREREEDVVEALARGADDYMTKPVKRGETLARIAALARRSEARAPERTRAPEPDAFEFPPFRFETRTHTAHRGDETVDLTEREFALALYLFRNAGQLLSRGHLLGAVWGKRADLNTRTVDTHMSRVRRKLALDPSTGWRVRSVYQHGYRLEPTET